MRSLPEDVAQICRALRSVVGASHKPLRPESPTDVDWARLASLAETHRVTALLDEGAGHPAALHHAASRARLSALAQTADLIRLSREFQVRGIPLLSYKGPVLAQQAYGSALMRTCSDLDLVIRPEDADKALGLLRQAGYREAHAFTRAQHACFRAVDGDYPLVHEQSGTLVELHCRVSSRRFGFNLETADLWARRQRLTLGGYELATTGDEDTLVVLAVHGAKHRWRRLEWIAAFAAMLGRTDAALQERTIARAVSVGARRALLLAARLAAVLLGAPTGPALNAAIRADRTIDRLVDDALEALIAEADSAGNGRATTRQNLIFGFRVLESPLDRARYCGRWLFVPSPEDWRMMPLPAGFFAAHCVLRPARLLATYVRAYSPT